MMSHVVTVKSISFSSNRKIWSWKLTVASSVYELILESMFYRKEMAQSFWRNRRLWGCILQSFRKILPIPSLARTWPYRSSRIFTFHFYTKVNISISSEMGDKRKVVIEAGIMEEKKHLKTPHIIIASGQRYHTGLSQLHKPTKF